jgi:hypothetical protein
VSAAKFADIESPKQFVYLYLSVEGPIFVTLYSNDTQGDGDGVGVGVGVGVGEGVGLIPGSQLRQDPSVTGPISVINSIMSTPLIFSNNP